MGSSIDIVTSLQKGDWILGECDEHMVMSPGPDKCLFGNYLSIYCTRGTELDAGAGHASTVCMLGAPNF